MYVMYICMYIYNTLGILNALRHFLLTQQKAVFCEY